MENKVLRIAKKQLEQIVHEKRIKFLSEHKKYKNSPTSYGSLLQAQQDYADANFEYQKHKDGKENLKNYIGDGI